MKQPLVSKADFKVNRMKIKNLSPLLVLFIVFICASCSGDEDFSNPLDPENLRTAGSPTGLTLSPGDQLVRVSWTDISLDGIVKYRIYRRFTGDPNPQFQRIGEVDATQTEFLDTKDIKNDQFDLELGKQLFYEYRISYVDRDGVETPDPNSPPSEGHRSSQNLAHRQNHSEQSRLPLQPCFLEIRQI